MHSRPFAYRHKRCCSNAFPSIVQFHPLSDDLGSSSPLCKDINECWLFHCTSSEICLYAWQAPHHVSIHRISFFHDHRVSREVVPRAISTRAPHVFFGTARTWYGSGMICIIHFASQSCFLGQIAEKQIHVRIQCTWTIHVFPSVTLSLRRVWEDRFELVVYGTDSGHAQFCLRLMFVRCAFGLHFQSVAYRFVFGYADFNCGNPLFALVDRL